jgi:predicted HicB family RNase H-like nuclease
MAGRVEEFTIRVAPEIKAEIEVAAAAEQRSLAGLIRVLLADALAARRAAQQQPARSGK